ncbi:MAG: hypothetical protein ACOH1X_09240 [Kaistella sp.]
MRLFFSFISIISAAILLQAQQISLQEIANNNRFQKNIDMFNNGETKIYYSDVLGIPYYQSDFIPAKVNETSEVFSIRYNSFLDAVEILNNSDVYQLPKDETSPDFRFETTNEKLVFVKTDDIYSGYFFVISEGRNRILKKVITKFYPAKPAANTLIPGDAARFQMQKPIYFLQTASGVKKLPKNEKEFIAIFPEKKEALNEFFKKNKIKLNKDQDLVKLGKFLAQ